jgi:hypothetical protein
MSTATSGMQRTGRPTPDFAALIQATRLAIQLKPFVLKSVIASAAATAVG